MSSSSTFIPDSLEDPQFIPGENIGTGNGEPILAPPTRPREAPTEFGEVVRQTFDSAPEIAVLFIVAEIYTVVPRHRRPPRCDVHPSHSEDGPR